MTEHDTIAAALVAALTDLTNVAKAHKADTGKYGYTYASISDLIADTRPTLAEHGLVALTPVHEHPEGLACTVTILHSSGERLDFGPTPFPSGKDAQSTGSWITYMRRYCLLAALGMGAEDDDGQSAQASPRRQERPQEPKAQTFSAGNAKASLLERLGGMEGAKDAAARIWSEQVGDSRAITAGEWDALCEAADKALEHYRNEPLREAELLEAGDR